MISRAITPRRQGRRAITLLAVAGLVAGMLVVSGTASAAKPANYAASIDQCRNGGLEDPQTNVVDCAGNGTGSSGWVNGNAGASNAHYAEGESISYRARLTGFTADDQVTLIIGYDVIHSGVPAIDYLTDKNRWQLPEATVAEHPDDPDDTVGGLGDPDAIAPIPAPTTNIYVDKSKAFDDACHAASDGTGYVQQPVTSFNAVSGNGQAEMEFFGGTAADNAIRYVGPVPDLFDTGGSQEQQVSITFTADRSNPVISWGGHIASRLDWGCADGPQSASGISGSPYHMRLKGFVVNDTPVNLGNQDRSLSAAAVIFAEPGITTQVKKVSDDSNVANNASLSLGTAVYDTATLGGALGTASGTVDYYVEKGDSSCTIADATSLGPKTVTGGVIPQSTNYTFTSPGTYYFWAVYSGDNNNAGATSDCSTEIVVVPKASPSFTTLASPATSIVVGKLTTVGDTATFSGGYNPSGNVSFALYSDSTCTTAVIGVSGSGAISGITASYSTSWTPTVSGTYYWKVDYPGDLNNNGHGPICGGSGETLTVIPATPGGSTAPAAQIRDTFTISGGYNPSGTVDFKLWTTSDCTGTPVDTDPAVALSGTSATSKWISVVSAGTYTYYWSAKFNSDDTTLNNDFGPVCGEQTTVGLSTSLNP